MHKTKIMHRERRKGDTYLSASSSVIYQSSVESYPWMHELKKVADEPSWAGNWVWDENVEEKLKYRPSAKKGIIVIPGYPGVMRIVRQPNILVYAFSKGDIHVGQGRRYFACKTPYLMYPGDSLDPGQRPGQPNEWAATAAALVATARPGCGPGRARLSCVPRGHADMGCDPCDGYLFPA